MKLSTYKYNSGFTIFELVIVIGIIAVLSGGVITLMGGFGETARIQRAETDIKSGIRPALESYKILAKKYPTTQQGLKALVEKPDSKIRWNQQFDSLPLDPWNNEYIYENNAGKIVLTSKGPDGQEGTEDDISSDD